jgi:hypothetical protein
MAGEMTITVDNAALLKAMADLGPAMERFTMAAAKETADNIVREAQGRVARATGETARGIHAEVTHDGKGYVVLDTNRRMPNLPLWLEFGTQQGKPGSHSSLARPFFFSSAYLEAGAHDRRMREAVQNAIDSVGLGV